MKYIILIITLLAYTSPAAAQDVSWKCKNNHRGPVCMAESGEKWRGRTDHHGRRVWLNSNGKRITEYKKKNRTDLNMGNTTVGVHKILPSGREQLEFIGGRLLWCKTNHKGQKTCRQ